MDPQSRTDIANRMMLAFAERTGLSPPAPLPTRYLWTDAFAVCNFLALARLTGDPAMTRLAGDLVDQVHHTLGRFRADDPRQGWISGLSDDEGAGHPTQGGLRIGKELPERGPGEPYNEAREWDRDGQYFHYLTRWMHALGCMTREGGDPTYATWARELARGVHPRFVARSSAGMRMYWKMSTDLSRPLVPSMGQHDPLDGYVTYREICAPDTVPRQEGCLAEEAREMAGLCRGNALATEDTLGLGGLLADALRVTRMMAEGGRGFGDLPAAILAATLPGTAAAAATLAGPPAYRLPFRELGFALGLRGLLPMRAIVEEHPAIFAGSRLPGLIDAHLPFLPLADAIEGFWLRPENQAAVTWTGHREINSVMLASCLVAEEFLAL